MKRSTTPDRRTATAKGSNAPSARKGSNNLSHIMFRYVIITLFIFLFAGAIGYKLFSTTVLDAEEWNSKANAELQKTDTIAPVRGDILAADGTVLVTNLQFYNVRIDFGSEAFAKKEFVENLGALCDSLAKYFPTRDKDGWRDVLQKQYTAEKKSRSYKLLSRISYADLELVRSFPFFNMGNANKTGFIEEPFKKRDCPYGEMARLSIGSVGQTKKCKEIHGVSGLERSLDSLLYGTPGTYKRVAFTKRIGNWTDVPAVNGWNVTTTIDITLQDILEQELITMLDSCDAEWASAVLMEVSTGDIKAISNVERDTTGNYVEAYNRIVTAYEPGSVVKPISMMIALEDGLVNDIDEIIPIGASFPYGGGRAITDSHFNSQLTVAGVIEQSSNIGMARIIVRGYDKNPAGFVKRFEDLGFFEKMNSGIYEEEQPRIHRNPSRLDMSRMCFGYATAIPPLYTLSVYNAIANNGRYVRPRLVKALNRDGVDSVIPVSYIRDRICSEENAAKVRAMLRRVVDGDHGTGRRLKHCKVPLAGKTGTCYHLNLKTKQYETAKKRLAFCGFFPADNPKYSMFVLTFHPRKNLMGAASSSGLVMQNVAEKMYSRGMLGNTSDFHTDAPENPAAPLINAPAVAGAYTVLRNALSHKLKPRVIATPDDRHETGMPSVQNLSFRDALSKLEKAGYDVTFRGTGRVTSQQLIDKKKVLLTLSNS